MNKLIMTVVAAAAAMAATADNWSFTYQAELKDASGAQPLTGHQNVEIRLWKTASTKESGDLLWGRLYPVYLDKDGLFNLEVSDNEGGVLTAEPFPASTSTLESVLTSQSAGALYIGLTVAGQGATEIVPRQRIFAVPYAAKANRSLGLTGTTSPVEGVLQFKEGGAISSSGITLKGNGSTVSTITADHLEVQTITASGNITTGSGNTITAGNLAFTGTLMKSGSEVLPVPVGGIILWFKTTPPEGGSWSNGKSAHWAICNGNNGTPDLKGRFVVGIDPNDADYDGIGDNGGEKKHTLSSQEMPQHRHKYLGDDYLMNKSDAYAYHDPGDSKTYDFDLANGDSKYKDGRAYQGEAVGGGTDGKTVAHENRPPFYALYYIMRIN